LFLFTLIINALLINVLLINVLLINALHIHFTVIDAPTVTTAQIEHGERRQWQSAGQRHCVTGAHRAQIQR
jgi:hypothetical protein